MHARMHCVIDAVVLGKCVCVVNLKWKRKKISTSNLYRLLQTAYWFRFKAFFIAQARVMAVFFRFESGT